MEIKLNTNTESVGRISGSQPKKIEAQASEQASPVFAQSAALDQALRQSPDVRPEVVSNARQLVGSSSYPPSETIKKIASLLATNIGRES